MSAPTTLATSSRAELRRRRRRRRLQGVAALLVLALLGAAGVALSLVRRTPEPTVDVGTQARTQQTLLVQVLDRGGEAVSSTLYGVDDGAPPRAVGVLVPRQVVVDVAGAQAVPFGAALRTGSPEATRNALGDLLGVTVDHGWGLTLAVLVQLVDAVGGVEVELPGEVVSERQVVLAPGRQRLTGQQAVAVIEHRADGEQEEARLARQQLVLSGLITALPEDPAAVGQLLGGLGPRSVSDLEPPDLAARLVALRAATLARQVQYDVLPAEPLDTADTGEVRTARLDDERARELVDRLLAASLQPGARQEGNRVLVLDGVGRPEVGEQVRERLVAAGFVFVGSRPAPRTDYATTSVLVPEATPEQRELAESVAAAVGVPNDSVATADLGSVADVVVLVGADFGTEPAG